MSTVKDRGGMSRREKQRERQRMEMAKRRDVDADMPLYLRRAPVLGELEQALELGADVPSASDT